MGQIGQILPEMGKVFPREPIRGTLCEKGKICPICPIWDVPHKLFVVQLIYNSSASYMPVSVSPFSFHPVKLSASRRFPL